MVYRENLPPSDNASLSDLTLMGMTMMATDAAAVFTDHGCWRLLDAAFDICCCYQVVPECESGERCPCTVTVEANTAQLGAVAVYYTV